MNQPSPSIPTIIEIATICQYYANAALRNANFYPAKPVDARLGRLLYIERKGLQWAYNRNSSDTTLQAVANYVFSLCAPYVSKAQAVINNLTQAKPIITGPSNESVNSGDNAIFSVTVVSVLPVTYQWYRNGVLIPDAINSSYTLFNAQVSDSGSVFDVIVTNSVGSATSGNATLTVTASLIGYAYAGGTDYSSQLLLGIDNVPFQFNFPITSGQPLQVQYPGTVNAEYVVLKYPATESTKTNYNNLPIDTGTIPSLAFEAVVTIGPWKYVFSRTGNPFTLNSGNLLQLI